MKDTIKELAEGLSVKAAASRHEESETLQCLNNRYDLKERIGIGGLCEVFSATDKYAEYFGVEREVAIKLPSKKLLEKEDVAAFMYAEYDFLLRLHHPGLVRVFDFGIDKESGIPFIVLEYLKGQLLDEIPLAEIDAHKKMKLFISLSAVVNHLHVKGVVHADINPKNIMCFEDGSACLFDMGVSVDLQEKKPFHLDYQNIKAYNPRYTAPEILEGEYPSFQSDLFSLATIFVELYENTLPYESNSLELRENRSIPTKYIRKIPLGMRSWIFHAMKADPVLRPVKIPKALQKYNELLLQAQNVISKYVK